MIKVFKTITGDEVIGMVMNTTATSMSVEFPFLVHTDVDKTSKQSYTDLQPWMYGVEFNGPFTIPIHNLVVQPIDPKQHLVKRYKELVDLVCNQQESRVIIPPKIFETAGKNLKK